MNGATFTLPVSQTELRITELDFNPGASNDAEIAAGFVDNGAFEFIEIFNPSSVGSIDLSGIEFVEGVNFSFPSVELGPGERAVVVENTFAFRARYGDEINVLGQWTGGLSDAGEAITLLDATGQTIQAFTYDDAAPFPTSPDGGGTSLNVVDIEGDYNLGSNWVADAPSPGLADAVIGRGVADVIVSGSGFLAGFVDAVDGDGIGAGNGLGYSLAGAHQLESLPWSNIDTLYVQFTGDVSATLTDGSVLLTRYERRRL